MYKSITNVQAYFIKSYHREIISVLKSISYWGAPYIKNENMIEQISYDSYIFAFF